MLNPVAFYVAWAALPGLPLFGAVLVWRSRERGSAALRKCAAFAGGFLAVAAGAMAAGVETSSAEANFVLCLAALGAYWVLAAAAWAIPPVWLRISVGIAVYLPLVPSLALATIGLLALAFMVGDAVAPPLDSRRIDVTTICRVTRWGWAVGDGGYTVRIYRSPEWFPYLRQQIAAVTVNETNPGSGPEQASCESVAAGLR